MFFERFDENVWKVLDCICKFVINNFGENVLILINIVRILLKGLNVFNFEVFGFGIGFECDK